MRYRIAFATRVQQDAEASNMRPSAELDSNLADGIVAEKVFVEQLESDAEHGEEALEEDDDFLGSASPEVWEYEVVDARSAEFEEALSNSELILEWDVVDSSMTSSDDVSKGVLKDEGVFPPDGSGRRPDGANEAKEEARVGSDGGALEDLNVVNANDPRLGLTNRGAKPAEDWAANTGPTKNPVTRPTGNKRPAHATKG